MHAAMMTMPQPPRERKHPEFLDGLQGNESRLIVAEVDTSTSIVQARAISVAHSTTRMSALAPTTTNITSRQTRINRVLVPVQKEVMKPITGNSPSSKTMDETFSVATMLRVYPSKHPTKKNNNKNSVWHAQQDTTHKRWAKTTQWRHCTCG